MTYDVENVVIGAGVVGLAIARDLAISGKEVLVLEQHSQFGEETSSRNSEVIHAGIYYPKGSFKARFCVEGKSMLYQYCQDFHIPHRKVGKLIVATHPNERVTLDSILKKAVENGVTDLQRLSIDELKRLEPALSCIDALLSPSTGIIDTHQYMLSLVGEIENHGGNIAYNSPFSGALQIDSGFKILSGTTRIICKNLINCAGLSAQKVASQINGLPSRSIPKQYLAKGSYFTMHSPSPFNHLIYPVPNTASLGIHVTLDLAGQIRFGPDQEWIDKIDYDIDGERAEDFYGAIRRYYPTLRNDSLIPAYAGIRPKTQSPTSGPTDFCFSGPKDHGISGLVNLFGIESPGLTASLRIGQHVNDILYDSDGP